MVRAVLLAGASDVLAAASRLDFLTMAECLVVVVRDAGKESTHPFPFSTYSALGGLRQDPGRAAESLAEARICGNGSREVRVLSTYGSRGDVEPMVGPAVRLRALGAELLADVGVPLMPIGQPWRSMVRPSAAGMPRRTAELIATQFDTITAEAEGCDLLVASGVTHFAARSAAEKLGIRYVYATFCPVMLPSPYRPPLQRPGRPLPPEGADNRVLRDLDTQSYNALFGVALNTHRASIGLSLVDSVRDHVFTGQPWLAADPTLGPWQEPMDLDVVQTGAWILPDVRSLPAELVAFLDAGTPPVYVGFGSMRRVPEDIARVAIEAIRAQGRRVLVSRGWAGLALIDDRDDCLGVGEVNQQALFGRVADLGIGAAHDGPTPTTESLSAALRTALTPETRARATAVAGTIRTDGATVAATLLLDAVSRERATSVGVNHPGSSSQGKCLAPGCIANSACSKRPAYSAAFRGGSPASYSPASNSTGFQIILLRNSHAVQRILNDVKFTVVKFTVVK
jgi:vancomycin aglycone glucosyltransferase